jgi:Fur family ferric uptake transcriptional regulator
LRTVTVAEQLREHGLRVTAGRIAVLEAISELGGHPDALAVASHVRAARGSVSTQAVYDALSALAGAGLLRAIEPPGSSVRYETRVADNHHHLVCRACGTIVDVDCEAPGAPCLHPTGDHGFAIDEAEVVFWGVCLRCRAASP